MIYTQPKIVSDDFCKRLIAYFDSHTDQIRPTDTLAQQLFNGRDMEPYDVKDHELRRELEVLRTKATIKMSKLYDTELYLDYWDLVKWEEGQFMRMHADNVDEYRRPFGYCGWRSHSAILYLNQDCEGGETIFKNQQCRFFPETGKLLMFPAGYDYTHGVTKVESGTRYTIALWFTEDEKKCMTR